MDINDKIEVMLWDEYNHYKGNAKLNITWHEFFYYLGHSIQGNITPPPEKLN